MKYFEFSEENVWHLASEVSKKDKDNLKFYHIVIISNEAKTVPLWRQKSAQNAQQMVIWDYHVILVYKHPSNSRNCLVYDLDCDLAFPVDFETYVSETIRSDDDLESRYHRKFRMVPAQVFLDHFASDRSHMIDPDGAWLHPPPAYPPILSKNSTNNLDQYIDMSTSSTIYGRVVTLNDFTRVFRKEIV